MQNSEFRVFLSSTFRDLMPEREVLIKKVFPRIRAKCRERGVEFTEIDLRWGITAEESRSGRVVRICLEEIDRCPYFIGILGSRYGWAPGLEELEKDAEVFERYPWLREYAIANKSVTEMEIACGAIRPYKHDKSFFYEQTSKLDEIPEADRERFDGLKTEIKKNDLPYRTFFTPEELGEQVYRDLLSLLDRDYPIEYEPSPLDLERAPHTAFSLNRLRSYVANPEYLSRFEQYFESDDPPLIVNARSGLGKSALMAYLCDAHLQKHPDAFVIKHFIGAAAAGSDPEDVMRQVMMEIKDRYKLDDEIPTDDQRIREEFPTWLAKVQNEKLLLAIDALNQLSGVAGELHWLPEFIPKNVRLIVSTTPGPTLDQLRKHQWNELELKPLEIAMRRRIAEEYLSRYHKTLSAEQLDVIAEDPKCESPLFLRTLLEELRVFGRFGAFELHLANYLASNDERDLFSKILERMESDYGRDIVGSIMQTILASRYGLSQTELLGITKLSQLALSEFLIALEYHLMQRTGLYTFFHNYLRESVEERYANSDSLKKEAHRTVAEYFATTEYDVRRRDEEPWQWRQTGDSEKFKQCITDIPMLEMLLDEDRRQELIGLWVELQKQYDLAETYHNAIEQFRAANPDDEQHFADLSGKLGDALVAASSYKEAEHQLSTALTLQTKLHGEDNLKVAQAMNDLAVLFNHNGNFNEAELLFQNTILIREKILGKNDKETARSINDLGVLFYLQGKLDKAVECFQDALRRYQVYFRKDHGDIASTLSNLGAVSYLRKNFDDSINYYKRAIEMYEHLYGSISVGGLISMSNLALAYSETGEYIRSEELFLKTITITKSIYGDFHNSLAGLYHNTGVLYSRLKEYKKAVDMLTNGLEIKKRLLGEDHFETVNSYLSVGMNLYRSGEREEGKNLIEHYLPIQKEKLGADHQMYKVQENAWNELKPS